MQRRRILGIGDVQLRLKKLADLIPTDWQLSHTPYNAECVTAALKGSFDLILLDCREQTARGIQYCRGLRAIDELASTPIVILAAAEDSATRMAALEAEADDCISEALDSRESGLRLNAVVRRNGAQSARKRLAYADVELDIDSFKVRRGDSTIYLPTIQFRLLRHFLRYPTIVFSRRDLLEQVWNDTSIDERSVNVAIVRLRRAINSRGGANLIRTVPGLGYALDIEADV